LATANAQLEIRPDHQKTTFPSEGRYEIVQSEIAAKYTFRLDRFTGKVSQLVEDSEHNVSWEEMTVMKLPKISNPKTPRFLIFISGLAARHTFLMDSFTGNTWVLANDTATPGITVWDPMW
jgi:hypothetical protein